MDEIFVRAATFLGIGLVSGYLSGLGIGGGAFTTPTLKAFNVPLSQG